MCERGLQQRTLTPLKWPKCLPAPLQPYPISQGGWPACLGLSVMGRSRVKEGPGRLGMSTILSLFILASPSATVTGMRQG